MQLVIPSYTEQYKIYNSNAVYYTQQYCTVQNIQCNCSSLYPAILYSTKYTVQMQLISLHNKVQYKMCSANVAPYGLQ